MIMASPRKIQSTVQDKIEPSEVKTTEKGVQPQAVLSFEEYVKKAGPTAGLVASFSYEAEQSEKGLKPRSEVEWKEDFEAQENREYKSFQ